MKRALPTALLLGVLVSAAGAQDAPPPAPPPAPPAAEPSTKPATKPATPAALVFLRVNERGAEEWLRVKDGAVVVRVPGGPYAKRPYEGTVATADPRPVEVPSLLMDRCEVTNAQFARFLAAVPDAAKHVRDGIPGLRRTETGWEAEPGLERHPVTAATGHGALAFAEWVGGRIPAQPEWEKAAGGAEGRLYPWGDEAPDAARANFGRPVPRGLEAVGSHPAGASPYGCLDMAGNAYDRVMTRTRDGRSGPVMVKGGSWLTPHPLNLRVLDLCMQSASVAERSVGFRCAMDDPEPARASRTAEAPAHLRLATDFDAAVADAKARRLPVFLSLLHDTCGQCDRTRTQLYADPRFVAYCNDRMVVVFGHIPGDALDDPHPAAADGACPLYPGLACAQHLALYRRGLAVVGTYVVSPGNFVLHPDRIEKGAGAKAVLVPEARLPKWGDAVEEYLAVFEEARKALAPESPK